jgi:hypothetical protein|tara:strand:- start:325 stop:564 length:240 start_codon:yes stop_codon:yes gene_type:complete
MVDGQWSMAAGISPARAWPGWAVGVLGGLNAPNCLVASSSARRDAFSEGRYEEKLVGALLASASGGVEVLRVRRPRARG